MLRPADEDEISTQSVEAGDHVDTSAPRDEVVDVDGDVVHKVPLRNRLARSRGNERLPIAERLRELAVVLAVPSESDKVLAAELGACEVAFHFTTF
jgi:hypothetical protein